MDDDLGTPAALAAVHTVVREGNAALDAADDKRALGAAGSVRAMTGLLGLDPMEQELPAEAAGGEHAALSTLVEEILAERQCARASKDFATADVLRDRLTKAGIAVEDSPDGPQWTMMES
jgi:cysteinyl-tRNA synthetase